jgi:TPR repeat protein
MANLGIMYAGGVGMERDDVRAHALLQAALEIGLPASLREATLGQLQQVAARLKNRELTPASQLSAAASTM